MASPNNARFSTYSGAPSLHPSLAGTLETNDAQSARNSQTTTTCLYPLLMSEKGNLAYHPASMASTSTLSASDPKAADIKSWSGALERMQDERLEKQRFVMNDTKTDEVAKLALGAKVERALARRMVGQDATFRTKKVKKAMDSEKRSVEVQAR